MAILYPIPQEDRPPRSRVLMEIPDGPAGIAVTLAQMRQWTIAYRTDATIHDLASAIVSSLPGKGYFDEAEAVQNWVRMNIRYVRDIYDVETLQTPLVTLERGQGDCDDQALLVATLLQAIGHPVRFVAFAFEGPGLFDHVYTETLIGPRWYGAETTESQAFLGWRPPTPYATMIRTV